MLSIIVHCLQAHRWLMYDIWCDGIIANDGRIICHRGRIYSWRLRFYMHIACIWYGVNLISVRRNRVHNIVRMHNICLVFSFISYIETRKKNVLKNNTALCYLIESYSV